MSVHAPAPFATPIPTQPCSGAALRAVFSFPVVRVALLCMLTVLTARSRFNNADTWWHLKLGEVIWNTHAVPRTDTFSFTTNHHSYIPHEWLSQLTIYAVFHFGGYTGLMLWLCVIASLVALAGYALCWLHSGSGRVAFLGALGIWFFATIGFSIRPELLGHFFLICELLIISLGRIRSARWFFLLPPLFAVWVNCHGSFFFGIAVIAAILFCSFFEFRSGLLASIRWPKSDRNRLAVCFGLSVAALFINPVGPKLIWYPLDLMFKQQLNLGIVTEWQPTPFDDMRAWGLLLIAGLLLLLPLIKRIDITLQELVLTALAFGSAVQHQRMLVIFGIFAMPVICRMVALGSYTARRERNRLLPNGLILLLATAVIAFGFPSTRNLVEQVNAGNPAKALEFVRNSGLSGRMLNDYDAGGYLIWAAPEHPVFIDGRADIFEWTGVFKDYLKWVMLREDPRVILDKYRIAFCVLPRRAPISQAMQLVPGWKSIYSDDMWVVFARDGAARSAPVTKM
jgi:hypothetical protein